MKITEIILFTTNLEDQKSFYVDILNFEIHKETSDSVSFKIGKSILTFRSHSKSNPSHLAFNIPSNKIHEAILWLQARTGILIHEGQSIIDFSRWNAKAIYFYDRDKNIMEFIARNDLNVESKMEFTFESIISISEIAIATSNIETIYNRINEIKGIAIFDGDFESFCALGNNEGLFILIDKTKKKWFPTNDIAFTSDFIIKGDYNFGFIDGKIKELS